MAEVLGAVASGLTLAGLFKLCIEAFDLIQAGRQQEYELRKIRVRLEIERCRLAIWGESMGLTKSSRTCQDRLIDSVSHPRVVREILEILLQLFHNSEALKNKYGCERADDAQVLLDAEQPLALRNIAASFSHFRIRGTGSGTSAKVLRKVLWVIRDRKKFSALVSEIKDLVGGLHELTSSFVSSSQQASTVKRRIISIVDAETLSIIADACSDDHPDIADAASTRAETLSFASTHHQHVGRWVESVEETSVDDSSRQSPDIDTLTETELKHEVLRLRQERKERKSTAATTPTSSHPPLAVPTRYTNIMGISRYEPPVFTNPWVSVPSAINTSNTPESGLRDDLIQAFEVSVSTSATRQHDAFAEALKASRGMVPMGQSDITPRNIYGNTAATLSSSGTYGFPGTQTSYAASYESNSVGYPDYYSSTDRSSVTDSVEMSSRVLPRPSCLPGGDMPPALHSLMGEFRSSVAANSQKKHKCKICDKRFARPSSLQTHMYSHTGEKPFACEVEGCGRHFAVVSNLRRHRKVHKIDEDAVVNNSDTAMGNTGQAETLVGAG